MGNKHYAKNMAFTLFCCEFENVVNRAFLVLIFWGNNLVSANFYAFCNYDLHGREGEGPVEISQVSNYLLIHTCLGFGHAEYIAEKRPVVHTRDPHQGTKA